MTAHNSTQIARHTAIVLAGAASLSLTFAAGSYIVRQIPDTQRPGVVISDSGAPPAAIRDAPRTDPVVTESVRIGDRIDRPSFLIRTRIEEPDAPPATTIVAPRADRVAVTPAPPTGVGGRLGIGTAYVGAHFAPERNSVAFTVDTNLFSTLSDFLRSEQFRDDFGTEADPSGITAVRTEIDTRRGKVTFTLSDPALGEHDLRVDRTPIPSAISETSSDTVTAQRSRA
ncbi:hypothetical protein [Nocardia sp. NPDC005366]|uniref:hypothetical protein n=1 Tax=Nocardia sp. NPDC005366 TaxID=3156878 RepID=UPI0033B73F15